MKRGFKVNGSNVEAELILNKAKTKFDGDQKYENENMMKITTGIGQRLVGDF